MRGMSQTCLSRHGEPLAVYDSEYQAREAVRNIGGRKLLPYHCNACGLWHLSPKDRNTPSSNACACIDGNGKPKRLYDSRTAAERRASIIYRQSAVFLDIYRCPEGGGWHLTKGSAFG